MQAKSNIVPLKSKPSNSADKAAIGWLIVEIKWNNPAWGPKVIAAEVTRLIPTAKTTARSVSSTLSVHKSELAKRARLAA